MLFAVEDTTWLTPTFVVATLGLIVSVVSYIGNQQFTLWKERKQELMKALLKIANDTQQFKVACITALEAHQRVAATIPNTVPTTHERIAFHQQRIEQAQRERFQVFGRLHGASSQLRSNCIALDLLVGSKGDRLGKAIVAYVVHANIISSFEDRSLADFEREILNSGAEAIEKEIEPLWSKYASFVNFDSQ